MASMGVADPAELNPRMLRRRVDHLTTRSYAGIYHWLSAGELLEDPPRGWADDWREADADHFGEHAPLPWTEEAMFEVLTYPGAPNNGVSAKCQEPKPSAPGPTPKITKVHRPEGMPGH